MFLRSIRLRDYPGHSYIRDLPVTRALLSGEPMLFDVPVTFIVGENGSGKSTLVEAIAVALGFNAEGGSKNMNFGTVNTASDLHSSLELVRSRNPRDGYFFRAETHYNIASEYDRQANALGGMPPPGGKSLHAMSHGESVFQIIEHRFHSFGLFILDEPEAGLSPLRQLALLARIHELAAAGAQFIIATHSPVLLAVPDARIYQISESGIAAVTFDECENVQLTREFLGDTGEFVAELLGE
ncbi:AAA family ATPase [Corynebacterium sp. H128]|uniref:AAA family ATPase n=1 Tax=Corynebacterium sp. H128 TaxID=3133427 RepID=UPI0030B6B863